MAAQQKLIRGQQQVEQATRQVARNPWITRLGRLGYVARGSVYLVVGLLAALAAIGWGGAVTDSQGALTTILAQPLGGVLLALVALGLFGYALWRAIQCFADTEGKGGEAKGLAVRFGYLVSGVIYGALGLSAIQLLRGVGGGGDDAQAWTARLMEQPAGRWLVALVGAIIVGVGLYQLYKGISKRFCEELRTGEMSEVERRWAERLGLFGHVAHGVVLGIVGGFVLLAALRYDPSEARGIEGALAALLNRPFGPWLLGAVALGLVAYGVYNMFEARYRQMIRSTPRVLTER
jgi:hypothetical protein